MATDPGDRDKAEKVRQVVRGHLLELLASDSEVRVTVGRLVTALEPVAERLGRPQESEAALVERMMDALDVVIRRAVRPEALRRP